MGDMHTEPQTMPAPPLGRYEIDVSRSKVTFRTRHMFGLGPVRGTFAIRSGSVDIAEPLGDSAVHAEIDAASFRTGNGQRDQAVLSARLLDAARFPALSFRGQPDGKTIHGTLTVRDVARPVSLSIGQLTVGGQSFTATATVRVDRTEFGVTAMRGLAGRYLDLTAEVRCTRGQPGGTAHA
jgi:polyisoprenoid-binding protein YceI